MRGTIENSSEVAISLSFNAREKLSVPSVDAGGVTAEYAEGAEVSETQAKIRTVLKLCVLCDLCGDTSLDFLDSAAMR